MRLTHAALALLTGGFAFFCLAQRSAQAQDVGGDVKFGVEHDSNVYRSYGGDGGEGSAGVAPTKKCGTVEEDVQPGVMADGLARYFARVQTAHGFGRRHRLSSKWLAGGKTYVAERGENSQVLQGSLNHRLLVIDGLAWTTSASVKDRSECKSRRDYLRLGGATGPATRLGPLTLYAQAGYEEMHFKPAPQYSSTGPRLSAGVSWDISEEFSARFSYAFQWRRLRVDRTVDNNGIAEPDEGTPRRDKVENAALGVSYEGPVIVKLDGVFLRTRSNSFGAGSDRYTGVVTVTWPLLDVLTLHGRVSLQRAQYQDQLLVDPSLFVDEANRNSYVFAADWFFYDAFFAEFKTSLYTQEFGTDTLEYERTLYFAGLGAEF